MLAKSTSGRTRRRAGGCRHLDHDPYLDMRRVGVLGEHVGENRSCPTTSSGSVTMGNMTRTDTSRAAITMPRSCSAKTYG